MKGKKRGPFDIILFWDIIVMTVFGLIMIFSASSPSAFKEFGNSYHFAGRQLIWAVIGIGAMIFVANIDFRIYKRLWPLMYFISLILLIVVMAMGFVSKGAQRWINLGFITFQPSEITKIVTVISLAAYFDILRDNRQTWKNIYIPIGIIAGIPCILIVLQPHFSAVVILAFTTLLMMLVFGVRFIYYIAPVSFGVPVAIAMVVKEPYRFKRILSFMDPFADKLGDGWQVVQSLYAIGSGGFTGLGLTRSRQKYLYIPEPQNDFIFSIICEELGFIGSVFLFFLFGVLLWRCIVIAINSEEYFGALLAFGICMLTIIQFILNIGVATSSVPPTGVPLPFFSYGGTAFVFQTVSMGIVLNISRYRKDKV